MLRYLPDTRKAETISVLKKGDQNYKNCRGINIPIAGYEEYAKVMCNRLAAFSDNIEEEISV